MGKTAQKKKQSFLKTRLGGFAAKFGKGSQKSNKAMSPVVEAGPPGTWSVTRVRSARDKQDHQGCEGLVKDHFARVPEDHVEQEKREKAIEHIDKLIERISRLQDDIDKSLQTRERLEREIIGMVAAREQPTNQAPQRKRVKEHRKPQTDESPERPVPKSKKQSQRNTQKDNSQHVNRKVRKKLCLKCKKQKAGNDFHKDKSCKDGLARWCKECKAKTAKKYRKKQKAVRN